jgi:hypothetical protein
MNGIGKGGKAMKPKQTHRKTASGAFLLVPFLIALASLSGCGSSTLSDEEIEDPTGIPAVFAVSSITDGSLQEGKVTARAIFKGEGLTTVDLMNGEVEIEDPQGNIYPMAVGYNRLGAPSYKAELPREIELGAFYTFRVTLPSGRLIINSIKTPDQDLQVTEPFTGQVIERSEPVEVRWTGRSNRNVAIVIGPEQPNVLDFLQSGSANTADDGRSVLDPASMVRVREGENLLTVIRSRAARANGFHPGSRVGAVLLTSQPVIVD